MKRLRDQHRGELAEPGRQPRQVVGTADDERDVVDRGRCRPAASLRDHRLLRIHGHDLADEGRQPEGDVSRPGPEVENTIGSGPAEVCGEQPQECLGRPVAVLGVEPGGVPVRPLIRREARPPIGPLGHRRRP